MHQVHLQVGDVRARAQVVVTHQAVEVDRRGGAGVELEVGDLGHLGQVVGDLAGDARGGLERRALGHVDHHLELALVVEGQHLDADQLRRHQRHGAQKQDEDHRQEGPAAARAREQRLQDAAVEAVETAVLDAVPLLFVVLVPGALE